MKKKQQQTGVKGLIIGIILLCLVLGYYYYLTNRRTADRQEEVEITEVQEILLRNLDTNYPPTPREVVNYYARIAKCLYDETYTDEEFQKLAMKIQMLYDEELVANKTKEQYLEDLKWDITQFKEKEIVISSYTPSSSTDVEEYKKDGYSWAKLYCTFNLRQGTQLSSTQEILLLRKDEQGHWKIYGWKLAEE